MCQFRNQCRRAPAFGTTIFAVQINLCVCVCVYRHACCGVRCFCVFHIHSGPLFNIMTTHTHTSRRSGRLHVLRRRSLRCIMIITIIITHALNTTYMYIWHVCVCALAPSVMMVNVHINPSDRCVCVCVCPCDASQYHHYALIDTITRTYTHTHMQYNIRCEMRSRIRVNMFNVHNIKRHAIL